MTANTTPKCQHTEHSVTFKKCYTFAYYSLDMSTIFYDFGRNVTKKLSNI